MRRPILVLVCFLVAIPSLASTLLVANKSDHTLDFVDLETGVSRATVPTGEAPHEVAVAPDQSLAVVSNYGTRERAGSSLTVVDLVTGSVLRTIELGRHTRPHGLAWIAANRLVVTAEGSAHVLVVDPLTGAISAEIETAQRISHMVAAGAGSTRAFVANIGSGSVTVVDLDKGLKVADVTTGAGAEGIALSPDGRELWVTNREADTISVLDPTSLELLATIPCPGFPIRVAFLPDGTSALVSAARTGEVVVFDVAERKEKIRRSLDLSTVADAATRLFGDRFGSSPVPVGLVVAPDGRTAWIAATQADVVVAIDPATVEVTGLLRAGREPDGMAWTSAIVRAAAEEPPTSPDSPQP